ncbi:PIN/TRAM domain-containing protein [Lapidilactobacillus bayanensis]|uniref:PIN/TRAM domain-containing protein n=1 Tax=Lapidilactobacillus bayanensis TaxID=2485998 RepID=UPI000F771FB4|nr:PIN/TRAM domain-containing protein [Lapidilactobacillus bayanensis]
MNKKLSRKLLGRIIFVITGLAVGYSVLPAVWFILRLANVDWLNFPVTNTLLGALIFYLLSFIFLDPILSLLRKTEKMLLTISPTKLLFGSLFLLAGLILANVIAIPLYRINIFVVSTILPVVLMIVLGYLGFRVGTQTDDWRKLFKTRRGNDVENLIYDRKPDDNFHKYKILDTSVIIDGRIHDIVKTGFVEGVLLVPVFVVHELQLISDSADSLKRARGRRGLDILNDMKSDPDVKIENYDGDFDDLTEVDSKLLKLAKIIDGIVVTNDYNLSKVSEFQNVPVLNINQLANTLKPAVLPGEAMDVTVVKSGTERQQGVAYLEDGTMVVVEDGQFYLNKHITVVITSALQTAAGRMIFARPQHAQRGITSDEKTKKDDTKPKK